MKSTFSKKKRCAFMLMLTLLLSMPAMAEEKEKLPAFPGAEGFGRYVTGGRGGKVYHVSNLNDSGTGSLRWALNQSGAKMIVFDVSGTIHLKSGLSIPSNTTIAGQSAPGDGICVADYPVSVSGNNVIIRYMRFRLGNVNVKVDGADGWDSFGGMDGQDMMIDHCSISWSIDECCSFLGNKNTTVQWCIVAQSLVNAGHSKGAHGYGGNWGGSGASFHHNLIAHHTSRTPRLGPRPTTQMDERMDMRNNVIYNFGGNGCYGGEGMNVNIVNNYYKPGPGSPTDNKGKRIAGIGIRTTSYINTYPAYAPAWHIWGKFFVDGNTNTKYPEVDMDNWTNGIYNQISSSDNDNTYTQMTKDTMKLNEPIPFILTTTHSAAEAYELVLDYAGASLHRDSFDELMVSDTRNGVATYTGKGLSEGFINSQDDNMPADATADWYAWPTLNMGNIPLDSDGDGIPDTYEDFNALDSSDPTDGAKIAKNGYTNLENYLNGLVAAITTKQVIGGTQMGDIQKVGEEGVEAKYELNQTTSNGDWTFNNGFSITSNKGYATGINLGIKYSRNEKYIINIPDGITIEKVEFSGYSYADNETAYLGELNGQTFEANNYVFPARVGNTEATYTISLLQPATKTISFTPRGQQVVWRITVYTVCTSDSMQTEYQLGDVFTEHVNLDDGNTTIMTFKITDSENKTIMVGDGNYAAIDSVTNSGPVIPIIVNGYTVTGINEMAFCYCSGITSVSIPNTVETIGTRAFEECSGLKNLYIPANVLIIEDRAFAYCSGLESIEVDENNQYYDSRNNCNALIQTSSNTLLVGCKNSVIPDGVTSIAEGAFRGCTELTNIVIPEGVKTIGASAFRGCTGLTSVLLPSTITSIGNYAFSAFDEVYNLTTVSVGMTSPVAITSEVFPNRANSILYVPKGSRPAYKSADYWKEFKQIIELEDGVPVKCEKPTITILANGKIKVESATEGATCVTNISASNAEPFTDGEISLNTPLTVFTVTAHATAEGYADSDEATATFRWERTEGDMNGDGIVNITDVIHLVNIILGN